MNILPVQQTTLVVSYPAHEVLNKIRAVVRSTDDSVFLNTSGKDYLFNGIVSGNRFTISRRVNQYQNFLPRMRGAVESTSLGSIIFVQYSLFFGSLFLIILSSAIMLFVGIVFLYMQGNISYFIFSMLLLIINYAVIVVNFNKQVEISRSDLERVINSRGKGVRD